MSPERARGDLLLIKRMLAEAKPYWPQISTILFLSLLSAPLALLTPLPLKIVVDNALGQAPLPDIAYVLAPEGALVSSVGVLILAIILVLLITFLQDLTGYARWILELYTGEKLVLDFRAKVFGYIQRLSLSFHDSRGVSDSLYRIQYDVSAMQYFTINGVVPLFTLAVTLLAMIWIIARIDWALALVTLALIPLLVLFTELYRRRARHAWADVKARESGAMSVIQEVLGAVRVVKAFGQEQREEQRFHQRSYESLSTQLKAVFLETKFGMLVAMTISGGAAAALFIGARDVQRGVLSLGDLLVVMAYLAQMCKQLENLTRKVGSLQGAFASAERVFSVLDQFPDVPEPKEPRSIGHISGSITFKDVHFAYGPDPAVLTNISFQASAGMRVALSGPTGAGKTTLINLLPRFYDPTAGSVLLDDVDLRAFPIADLRRQFALVLQEPVLFSTTVAENIAYGRPPGSDEEIIAAAKAANAHDFIMKLPLGYDTPVGERGMRLSGGERQRISIARAFLRNAKILILDEPTSSVDSASEDLILEAIARLMRERTTFVIAHRPAALKNCDLHLHLRHGRLAQASDAQELV